MLQWLFKINSAKNSDILGDTGPADDNTEWLGVSPSLPTLYTYSYINSNFDRTFMSVPSNYRTCCIHKSAVKSQNTVKPNPLCRLPVTSVTSRDVPFSPNSITPTSLKLPVQGSFGEVGVMEFGLKGTSRLVADVTGGRHSGLGFTVFWLFTAQVTEDVTLPRFAILNRQTVPWVCI